MSDLSEEEPLLEPGTVIASKYEIVRRLGAGGMGSVYEARHKRMGKKVALKLIHRKFAKNADAVVRFLREAEAASKIRHPNVIDVIDIDELHDPPFMVLEFLEGQSLASILEREGKLPLKQTAALLAPVLGAVAAAHEQGIVHRDIKPENIFVARTGDGGTRPVVLDFGVAKIEGGMFQGLTQTSAMVGTVVYMSPEQARDSKRVDGRSDQYTLGVLLYECLAGRRPVDGESLYAVLTAIVEGKYPPLREVAPGLDDSILQIVERAMQRDPEKRFPTVRAMNDALLPLAVGATYTFQRDSWVVEYAFGSTMTAEGSENSGVAAAVKSVTGKRPGEISAETMAQQVSASGANLSGPTMTGSMPVVKDEPIALASTKRTAPSSTLGQSAIELPVAVNPSTVGRTETIGIVAERKPSPIFFAAAALSLVVVAAISVKFLFGGPSTPAATNSGPTVVTTTQTTASPTHVELPAVAATVLDAGSMVAPPTVAVVTGPVEQPRVESPRVRNNPRPRNNERPTTNTTNTNTTTPTVASPPPQQTPPAQNTHPTTGQQVGGGFVL